MDITSVDYQNNQLAITNEIREALQKANIQSSKFEDLIVNYRRLLAKYLQNISFKAEPSSIFTLMTEEGVKASKEYKALLQACEEQRNKYNNQLTVHNKALGDIIEMKDELDKTEKKVTALKEKVKSSKQDLYNMQKKIDIHKAEIEKYRKTTKDNEELENKILKLKEKNTESLEANVILNQRLQSLLNNLNDQLIQTEANKIIAENEKKKADLMFKQQEEKFKNIAETNSKFINDTFLSSKMSIEIPKALKTKIKAHQKGVTSLCFDSFGGNLLSSSIDGTVNRWDCMNNTETGVFSKFNGAVSEVAFDHSEKYMFAGSIDKTAQLWDLQKCELYHSFAAHTDYINCVKCFPMSIRALTGSSDKTIKEWDFNSSKNTRTFKALSACNALSIVNEENVIISGHSDGNVNFWSSQDKPEAEVELHDDKVLHLELFKNQIHLFSLSK